MNAACAKCKYTYLYSTNCYKIKYCKHICLRTRTTWHCMHQFAAKNSKFENRHLSWCKSNDTRYGKLKRISLTFFCKTLSELIKLRGKYLSMIHPKVLFYLDLQMLVLFFNLWVIDKQNCIGRNSSTFSRKSEKLVHSAYFFQYRHMCAERLGTLCWHVDCTRNL